MMKVLLVLAFLVPVPALAQAVVSAVARPEVTVYDAQHKDIGTRPAADLLNRPVVGPADDFGMVPVQTATGKVLVFDKGDHHHRDAAAARSVELLHHTAPPGSSQGMAVNGLSGRCGNAR